MRSLVRENNKVAVSNPTNFNLNASKKINCQISLPLLVKCQNLITSQHLARNYNYASLSDLIRKSLIAYQEKKLNLTTPRPTGQPKKTVCVVFPVEL
jgi:hypothetical protein